VNSVSRDGSSVRGDASSIPDASSAAVLRRLRVALLWDVRLQVRNGFYAATAFVLLIWASIALWLPPVDLRWLLPPLVLGNLILNTFYFMAALVLLENEERSLQARIVTPLRRAEYLAAKIISLSALALAENLLIVALLHGTGFSLWVMTAAILLASVQYALLGFIAVVRYDSINTFMMPSVLYTLAAQIPLIAWLAQWQHPILYLHPFQTALILGDMALGGSAPPGAAFGVVTSVAWLVALLLGARAAFSRLRIRLAVAA
jgi:fluoroquinolone transport system permease protein